MSTSQSDPSPPNRPDPGADDLGLRMTARTLIEGIPDPAMLVDCQYRIVLANEALRDMLGETERPIEGDVCYEVRTGADMGPPEGVAPCPLQMVLQHKAPLSTYQHFRDADGTEVHLDITASPILDDAGEVAYVVTILRDVTDRVRILRALQKSEHRLELALLGGDLGTWDWNVRTGEVLYDTCWGQMLGFSRDQIEPTLDFWEKLIHPEDRSYVKHILESHVRGDVPYYEAEIRIRTRGGQYKWVLSRGKAMERDVNGTAIRIVGVHQDITQRMEVRNRLRVSEEKYRSLFESSLDAIVHTDMDGRILDANRTCTDMMGRSLDELRAMTCWDMACGRGDGADGALRKQVLSRGYSDEFEGEVTRGDGKTVPVGVRVWLIRDYRGRPLDMWAIARDISERKRSELALRSSEQRLQLLAKATNEVVRDWDLRTGEIRWSPADRPLFGHEPQQVTGSVDWWKEHIHPEDRVRVTFGLNAALRGEAETWSDEYRFRRHDGSYADLLDRGYIVRDKEHRPVRIVASLLDVSERAQTERDLARKAAELEERNRHLETLARKAAG